MKITMYKSWFRKGDFTTTEMIWDITKAIIFLPIGIFLNIIAISILGLCIYLTIMMFRGL